MKKLVEESRADSACQIDAVFGNQDRPTCIPENHQKFRDFPQLFNYFNFLISSHKI
jgi:hypothetical protein